MYRFFSPAFLKTLTRFAFPWGVNLSCLFVLINLVMILSSGLKDYQQGISALIMFIHVPSSWLALAIYVGASFAAVSGLVWRTSLSFYYARSALFCGSFFALISLVTGSMWGKPMWGTFWVFDARLTSMLLLFLMYLGMLIISRQAGNEPKKQKGVFIVVLIGLVNVPIIKFSVDWWTTLHQPASIFRATGPAMDDTFLMYLASSFVSLSFLSLCLFILRAQTYLLEAKLKRDDFLKERLAHYSVLEEHQA